MFPGVVMPVFCVPSGFDEVMPTDGMSPAKAVVETTHRSAMTVIRCFMNVSPLRLFEDARILTSEEIEQLPEVLARYG
jgi:hypothetical protein